jgi:hypothetical protein
VRAPRLVRAPCLAPCLVSSRSFSPSRSFTHNPVLSLPSPSPPHVSPLPASCSTRPRTAALTHRLLVSMRPRRRQSFPRHSPVRRISFSSLTVRSQFFSLSWSQLPPPGSAPPSPRDRAKMSHATSTTRVAHPSLISTASTSGAATSIVVQCRHALAPQFLGPSSRGSSSTSAFQVPWPLRSAAPSTAVSSVPFCCSATLYSFIGVSFAGGLFWPQHQRGERPPGTR